MALLAVALATSGSRGQRLLFFYPTGKGTKLTEAEEKGLKLLKELPPSLLGELLTPASQLVNRRFSLQVDKWKFVGHPKAIPSFKDGEDVRVLQFNVVFILEASADVELLDQCHNLSDQLGTCLIHEEKRFDYVSQEVQGLLNRVDYSNLQNIEDFALIYSIVAKESTLAKTVIQLFGSIVAGSKSINIAVNKWSCLSWCPPRKSTTIVEPFHSFLLLEDVEQVMQSLPRETSSAFSKLLSSFSPVKTLQGLAENCDLPLDHVVRLVSHLVQWKRACVIQPLTESNVYMLTDRADVGRSSPLHELFARCDSFQSGSFLKVAASFSEALPLSDMQIRYQHEIVPIVVWMLQKKLITQLNTYVFLLPSHDPPTSSPDTPTVTSPTTAEDVNLDSVRAELTVDELTAVLRCVSQKNKTDIEKFTALVKYFRGTSSIPDIAQHELLRQSQILTIIDMFSCVLVTATIPDLMH